jgi:hypothetical protein
MKIGDLKENKDLIFSYNKRFPCEDQGFPPGTCIDKHYIDLTATFDEPGVACPAVCRDETGFNCCCVCPCENQGFPPGTCIDKHYINLNATFKDPGQPCPAVCRDETGVDCCCNCSSSSSKSSSSSESSSSSSSCEKCIYRFNSEYWCQGGWKTTGPEFVGEDCAQNTGSWDVNSTAGTATYDHVVDKVGSTCPNSTDFTPDDPPDISDCWPCYSLITQTVFSDVLMSNE